MKRFYFVIAMFSAAVFIVSCSNSSKDVQKPVVNSNTLSGVWELRNVVGGMFVHDPNNYLPGNGNLWAFTGTQFQGIYKDTVYKNGTYSISRGTGTDLNTGKTIDQFIFNDIPSESFELRDDTLRFYYGAMISDGDITMYVKIAEDTTGYFGALESNFF